MIRFVSFLFLLAGLAAAAFGGARLMDIDTTRFGIISAPDVNEAEDSVSSVALPALDVSPEPSSEPAAEPPSSGVVQPLSVPSAAARAPEPRFGRLRDEAPAKETETETASFIDRMYNVPVAYEAPTAAAYRESFDVTFALDGTGDQTAIDALPGEGANVVEGSAKISDRIKANLVGSAFDIELNSPDVQRVSLLEENVWRWRVTPVKAGEQSLILELFALEDGEAVPVRTFSERVEVKVSAFQRAVGLADTANPLFVVLGGIGSAIGGFFGFFRFFASKAR